MEPPPPPCIFTNAIYGTTAHMDGTEPTINTTRADVKKMNLKVEEAITLNTKKIHPDGIQGDTGANVHATNRLDLLWNYRPYEAPRSILTYDQQGNSKGQGEGTMLIVSDQGGILELNMIYIPGANGTIISPHRMLRDLQKKGYRYKKWSHDGAWDEENPHPPPKGSITFTGSDTFDDTSITMRQRRGLWYTTNTILIPRSQQASIKKLHSIMEDEELICLNQLDGDTEEEVEEILTRKERISVEQWHQRMGHISPKAMEQTQKHVLGIPKLPPVPSCFSCPFCDKAKLTKAPRNKKTTREILQPGVQFHMDCGFFSGPSNLQDVLHKGATPDTTIATSRDGYEGYLLIIDAASRYIWVFLLKSRHPPVDIIDKFLKQNGRKRKKGDIYISTTEGGLLDQSKSFLELIEGEEHKYERLAVRVDNGSEFLAQEIREVISDNGYVMELTGTDSSWMNGMAERPHRTLKERVRCLLYTAGLEIEFWADALLHAVWLYNRTYHSKIKMTPYEKWTLQKPVLYKLITFGARITSKTSHDRNTAGDPNAYDGIFLGYKATKDLIRYYDVHSQSEKNAKNNDVDEWHYGSKPSDRPPAAQHIIETITGDNHDQHRTDILLEEPVTVTPVEPLRTEPTQPSRVTRSGKKFKPTGKELHPSAKELIQDILDMVPPHPQTAVAAQVVQPDLEEMQVKLNMLLDLDKEELEEIMEEVEELLRRCTPDKATTDTLQAIIQT
jgi:transposase InsO family protein